MEREKAGLASINTAQKAVDDEIDGEQDIQVVQLAGEPRVLARSSRCSVRA